MNPQPVQPGLTARSVYGRGSGGIDLRAAARLAWSMWILSVLLTVFAALFYVLSLSIPLEGRDRPPLEFLPVLLTAFLAFSTVGALIASRRPENSIGWIFCALGIFLAGGFSAKFYADYTLIVRPDSLPGGEAVILGLSWTAPLLSTAPTFVFLLFPDGRLPSRRWQPVAWLAVGAATISIVGSVFRPGIPDGDYPTVTNPVGIAGSAENVLGLVSSAGAVLGTGALMLSVVSMIVRFRRSRGTERQQIKWIAYAGGVMISTFIAGEVIPGPELFVDLMWATGFVALAGLPIAAGIAILRHNLYDIDLIINRTLVYGALTAIVIGIYVLVVGYLGALFRTGGNLAVSLVATGIVAVLFAPLRDRLQKTVNRLMYGERDEPYAVLSRLGERLEATLEPEAVLPTIARTVREALKLPYAAVELGEGNGSFVAAESGSAVEDPVRLPLLYRGEEIGVLLLAPRRGEESFSPADNRLLNGLVRQAGVAAYAVRLTADLQRSRERLVTAREEERRRLRRDLHDGLGPTLGSLPLKLDVADDMVEQDPAAARALIRGLKTQAQSAVTDIRRLVYALRPPALDDLGLAGAIGETAAQYGANGLRISIELPEELPPLPAAVEVAAYRIAQEALTNVARHAAASECAVRLTLDEENRRLHLEIQDDGRGIPDERGRGVGITSMRERAAELGGSCVVEPSPTCGTRVRASLSYAGSEQEE